MTTKTFSIGAILSVTTRVLCAKGGMHEMKELLMYMANESPYEFQLSRFADECTPYLYEQFPWLQTITARRLVGKDCLKRVALLAKRYGEYHEVRPIHGEDHTRLNPADEFRDKMRSLGRDVEIIETPASDEPSLYGDINWKVE